MGVGHFEDVLSEEKIAFCHGYNTISGFYGPVYFFINDS